ncbi:hypothetical protein PYCCODRAFT_1261180 [Trametes coccinea BRFM310]|uniref:Uncharacterized protein n=1 Tax=Trametes coccinea (strain BRFM310) TaxID=1353009 RepID=A0A1Y2I7M1_TRAC3|nr:hypothetical protein PYCCODRAFT_1261180 [Trametes coccinea BRFM310]
MPGLFILPLHFPPSSSSSLLDVESHIEDAGHRMYAASLITAPRPSLEISSNVSASTPRHLVHLGVVGGTSSYQHITRYEPAATGSSPLRITQTVSPCS